MSRQAILAVDDDEEFLLYLRTALTSAGYEVEPASGAKDALALIAERRFALVLADLRLPGASGLDVLAAAREKDPMTVGIVLTGNASMDSALEALREGVYDYLLKPCSPDQLFAAVRRGLEHHALRRALVEKTSQLERQQRMLADVSHELKNPLSVVYGYASFLLKQPHEFRPDELQRSLKAIHGNAERLGHLLEELLESSRLHGRKIELERAPLSARSLCAQACDDFSPEAERRGISLFVSGGDDELVYADPKRVHQVLANLLTNALKFTPKGGTIAISHRRGGQSVVFSVVDTGCGIAAGDLPHLFERFYQAQATRRDHPGLGLGLEICKGLVELHGGRIWAESAPGSGTRMHFTLPVCVATALTGAKANP